jgi:hypothetical protein
MKQNKQHQFEAENDTVRIVYDFSGRNGTVKLTVFNKLDKPLVLDLNRSALIVNDKAVGFYSGRMELNASLNASSVGSRNFAITNGDIVGTATLAPGMVFIPAGTYVTQTPLAITDKNFDNIGDDKFQRRRYNEGRSDQYSVKAADFTRDSSPLVFKTYITLVQPDSASLAFTQQHSFYVSEVRQTTLKPSNLMDYDPTQGDLFFVSKMNQGAYAAGWTAGIAVALTMMAVSAHNGGTTN